MFAAPSVTFTQRTCHGFAELVVGTSSVFNAPMFFTSICIFVLFSCQVRIFVLDKQVCVQVNSATSIFCYGLSWLEPLSATLGQRQIHPGQVASSFSLTITPTGNLQLQCFLPPGTSACVLEAASWQLSQWASTACYCSPPHLSFLCWCTAWVTATFMPGCLDSRCCGKQHGIYFCSTGSTTCKKLSASGDNLL